MEIFIPGGILGIFGAVAWIAAAIIGLGKFDPPWNVLSAVAILFTGVLTFVVWIRYFPKSSIGKSLSLAKNGSDFKAHISDETMAIGTVGEALSDLRPSGLARFDGRRVDVVADGEWIGAGAAIKISSTANGHISVVQFNETGGE
ncbi:MAG: hypothetical protein K9M45_09350 [Kiritimatiellales bacterium]|nr:hypothetical protein [Kiritimatiellales bacterium]